MLESKIKTTTMTVLLAMVIFLSSCTNTKKLVEQGRYDEAVEFATNKLAGKKKKKEKYVTLLENAFDKATARDMKRIAKLERKDGNWDKIVDIYRVIRERQEMVEPLLPLIGKKGYHASFRFVKVDDLELAAMKKSANFHYQDGLDLLSDAERGSKIAARKAYEAFRCSEKYFENYKDVVSLKRKARELGITHFVFEMKNNAQVLLPQEFENTVLQMGVADLNTGWNRFHLTQPNNVVADFKVIMSLNDIDVSPERIKEREYVDVREIEDGFEYVLDQNGNVLKDTLGNDVTIPRKVLIEARVLEVFQSKAAIVGGHLEYYDMQTNELMKTMPVSVEAVFENYASKFRGDRRALTNISKRRCDTRPIPFPTDEELLLDAAETLKPLVRSKISSSRLI